MPSQPAGIAPLIGRVMARGLTVSDHRTDQRIIDAVVAELLVTPLQKLSLEDVAGRAGVTRMTVYRRFGDREHLIEATLAREVSRFTAEVAAVDDPDAAPVDRIADAFATALQLAHAHPVVVHWLTTDPGELLNTVLADDGYLLAAASQFIANALRKMASARLRNPDKAGELLARLFFALVLMPPTASDLSDPRQAGRLARQLVVPVVGD